MTINYVGIDMAKEKFDVALLRENSPLHHVFANTKTGFEGLLKWLEERTQNPWVALEATGHYSELLAEYLFKQGVRVSVVNPYQIKQFGRLRLARNKNDKADAILIAGYIQPMEPTLFVPRPAEQKQIRELIQLSDTLKGQKVQLQNQLDSVQCTDVKKCFQKTLRLLEKHIKSLAEKIRAAVEKSPSLMTSAQRLTAIKGIGEQSAYTILAYLPDLTYFRSAKQLAAFAGVSPRQCQSGQYEGKTYMSKCGHARLRKALYMPALSAKRYNEHLRPFVQRLEKNGLAPKAIVGALMRKLLHIIFGMLKNNQNFNPGLV